MFNEEKAHHFFSQPWKVVARAKGDRQILQLLKGRILREEEVGKECLPVWATGTQPFLTKPRGDVAHDARKFGWEVLISGACATC